MHLRSTAGKIFVTLNIEVDTSNGSPDLNSQHVKKSKPSSPSRLRRRERRKNARIVKAESSSGNADAVATEEADVLCSAENFISTCDAEQSCLKDDINDVLDDDTLLEPTSLDTSLTNSAKVNSPTPADAYCSVKIPSNELLEPTLMDLVETHHQPTLVPLPSHGTASFVQPSPPSFAEPGPSQMELQMLEMLRYLSSRT